MAAMTILKTRSAVNCSINDDKNGYQWQRQQQRRLGLQLIATTMKTKMAMDGSNNDNEVDIDGSNEDDGQCGYCWQQQ